MALSSNSLVHLTKDKKALIGILQECFKIKYCTEIISTSTGKINAAFPIVSFCDIPLSQIAKHIKSYGDYGIGLSKEWAKSKGLNPVLYIDELSTLGGDFRNFFKKFIADRNNPKYDELNQEDYTLIDLIRYMKNYQDKLTRADGSIIENYRFSDEREWRFVLPHQEGRQFYSIQQYNSPQAKLIANNTIKDFRLSFSPNDVRYIIIKQELERQDFLKIITECYGDKCPQNELERLKSKIITVEQIETDF